MGQSSGKNPWVFVKNINFKENWDFWPSKVTQMCPISWVTESKVCTKYPICVLHKICVHVLSKLSELKFSEDNTEKKWLSHLDNPYCSHTV